MMGAGTYHLVTLGCPKNQVDSDKLEGVLAADGLTPVGEAADADLIVVNTCAFIDEARRESIETVLALADERREDARLVVTGCLAERYGDDLDAALPEVDGVAGFGVPVTLGRRPEVDEPRIPSFDLLNLPRPPSSRPWAYVKVAEGCDRSCGFCAIPSFRGPQRSRSVGSILAEVDELDVREIVLVAQDLASFGRDQGVGERSIVPLVAKVAERVDRTYDTLIRMKKEGWPILSSTPYLESSRTYLKTGRFPAEGCDAGRLYFSISPNGQFSICHRTTHQYRHILPPHVTDGGFPPTQRRVVHGVVMDEGGDMKHLHGRSHR